MEEALKNSTEETIEDAWEGAGDSIEEIEEFTETEVTMEDPLE